MNSGKNETFPEKVLVKEAVNRLLGYLPNMKWSQKEFWWKKQVNELLACASNVTDAIIHQVQSALKAKGYNFGSDFGYSPCGH